MTTGVGAPRDRPRRYRYVGPPEIRAREHDAPPGVTIATPDALRAYCDAHAHARRSALTLTYVVTPAGVLRVADRRSEHVACAGGEDVLAAGELTVARERAACIVTEISNQSTGYCPDIACWPAVAAALDRVGVPHPGGFTFACVFRRCPACRERNLVKDAWYECALCGAALPRAWNFDIPS